MNFKESFKIKKEKFLKLFLAEISFYFIPYLYIFLLSHSFKLIFSDLAQTLQQLNSTQDFEAFASNLGNLYLGLISYVVLLLVGLFFIMNIITFTAYKIQFDKKIKSKENLWKFVLNNSLWGLGLILLLFVNILLMSLINHPTFSLFYVLIFGLLMVYYLFFKIVVLSSTINSKTLKESYKNLKYFFTRKILLDVLLLLVFFFVVSLISNFINLIPFKSVSSTLSLLVLFLYVVWVRNYIAEDYKELSQKQNKQKKPKKQTKKTTYKKSNKTKKTKNKKTTKKQKI